MPSQNAPVDAEPVAHLLGAARGGRIVVKLAVDDLLCFPVLQFRQSATKVCEGAGGPAGWMSPVRP